MNKTFQVSEKETMRGSKVCLGHLPITDSQPSGASPQQATPSQPPDKTKSIDFVFDVQY
jgi:hypothetical protein